MARTAEGAALTSQHRQQQLALRSATIRDLTRLWPLWNLDDFDTFDRFIAAAVPLIRARNRDSAGLAARYLRAFRSLEGIGGAAPIQIADRPQVQALAVSMRATGITGTANALKAGKSPQAARANGFVRVSGAAGRHVMDGARNTIVRTVGSDRQAQGWRRITSSNACDFCAGIANEGIRSEAGGFPAHDHCACVAEPAY